MCYGNLVVGMSYGTRCCWWGHLVAATACSCGRRRFTFFSPIIDHDCRRDLSSSASSVRSIGAIIIASSSQLVDRCCRPGKFSFALLHGRHPRGGQGDMSPRLYMKFKYFNHLKILKLPGG